MQQMQTAQGLVTRVLGGFYTVQTPQGPVECRARGVLRRQGLSPCAGDRAEIECLPDGGGYLLGVLPRKNCLVRPPVANVDQLVLVVSLADPAPNWLVVDKLAAIAEHQGIQPAFVFTKADLADPGEALSVYRRAGYRAEAFSARLPGGEGPVLALLRGRVSVLCGNTGAGKSSLLNRLDPQLGLATGQTSKKLGRGRHTTRHVELFPLEGGWVADTPGFTALETGRVGPILKEELAACFPEFAPYAARCRFTGCAHLGEKGCAVCEAVARGMIAPSRYESYRAMYEEAKAIKEWEVR